MSRKLFIGIIIILVIIVVIKVLLSPRSSVLQYSIKKVSPPILVSGRVGEYTINVLTGWSSPYSEVTLSSPGLARNTIADDKGFFGFYNIPVPRATDELCLTAQDVNLFPSFPTCLAPLPQNMDLEIYDVLLAPTIAVAGDKIPAGKTTKASGMTFPDAEVDVYLFTTPKFSIWAKLVKPAFAMSLPKYQIRTNQNGYFEFSLPASYPSENRVFASAIHAKGGSPKSNTLAFQTVGWLGMLGMFMRELLRQAGMFFGGLRHNSFGIIILEIIILIIFLFLWYKHTDKHGN